MRDEKGGENDYIHDTNVRTKNYEVIFLSVVDRSINEATENY